MKPVNHKFEIANRNWLPDMDSNHDKLLQRQLCYRYTIGQWPEQATESRKPVKAAEALRIPHRHIII